MTKCLWDQTFLKEKADALRITPSVQFWELDSELNVMKFKDEHFKKMIKNFFPFIGVHNLQLGERLHTPIEFIEKGLNFRPVYSSKGLEEKDV